MAEVACSGPTGCCSDVLSASRLTPGAVRIPARPWCVTHLPALIANSKGNSAWDFLKPNSRLKKKKNSAKSKCWQYHSHLKSGNHTLPSLHPSSEKCLCLCSCTWSRYIFMWAEEREKTKWLTLGIVHTAKKIPPLVWHHNCLNLHSFLGPGPVTIIIVLAAPFSSTEFRKKETREGCNALVSFPLHLLVVSATLVVLSWPLCNTCKCFNNYFLIKTQQICRAAGRFS